MSSKNRVSQIVKVKAATLALISLPMGLGFILTLLIHFMAVTFGTAYPLRPSALAYGLVAFGIIDQVSKVKHLRLGLTLLQLS